MLLSKALNLHCNCSVAKTIQNSSWKVKVVENNGSFPVSVYPGNFGKVH